MDKQLMIIENQLKQQHKRPSWVTFRASEIAPARTNSVIAASPVVTIIINDAPPPEQHPDYFPVLSALNAQGVQGQIISITSYKPICSEWHEIHALELGYYPWERRVVFALVRFGG